MRIKILAFELLLRSKEFGNYPPIEASEKTVAETIVTDSFEGLLAKIEWSWNFAQNATISNAPPIHLKDSDIHLLFVVFLKPLLKLISKRFSE